MSTFRQKEKHVTCPYDPSHSILPERLYKHVKKCALQNPDKALATMKVCPFLSTHIIPKEDYVEHVKNCPRRDTLRKWYPNIDLNYCFPNAPQ